MAYPSANTEALDGAGADACLLCQAVPRSDLSLEVKENILTVSGSRGEDDKDRKYLYRGIANRGFERKFQLADYVRVVDARLENGLLHITLKRELPEAMKPRQIAIGTKKAGPKTIEGKKAA